MPAAKGPFLIRPMNRVERWQTLVARWLARLADDGKATRWCRQFLAFVRRRPAKKPVFGMVGHFHTFVYIVCSRYIKLVRCGGWKPVSFDVEMCRHTMSKDNNNYKQVSMR